MHTRPRLRHHTNPEKPTRSGLLSHGTLNAGQATLTTDQKVGSSNLSGRAGQVPRFGGGLAGFGHESDIEIESPTQPVTKPTAPTPRLPRHDLWEGTTLFAILIRREDHVGYITR